MTSKKQRRYYPEEFKAEALQLAAKTSIPQAAKELGLPESKLYSWRTAANRKANVSDREAKLATENAKLKRQLTEQAEELQILKKAAVNSTGQCNNYTNSLKIRSCCNEIIKTSFFYL